MASGSINTAVADLSEREIQARQAGHLLYNSIGHAGLSNSGDRQRSVSITLPEDERACCGRMSPVRRTFCLMLVFDLGLTFILWVIYTQINNDPFFKSFTYQITHYTFKYSLFDTVLCAAWRFAPLQLAYALFKINSPWTVALTTFGTCVFLLCKVFMFDFTVVHNNIMCYFLLIMSFTIAWAETWFLDFKVLPREQKAREREALYRAYISDRTPLLDDATAGLNYHTGDQYYSPVDSQQGSEDEDDDFRSIPGTRGHSRQPSRSSGSFNLSYGAQEQEYLQIASQMWDKTWEMSQVQDGWRLEAGSMDNVIGSVCSRDYDGIGRVYRLQGIVNCRPKTLFQELVFGVTESPEWNPTVSECKILHIVDDTTDLLYNVANESAGGVVSSRDFVNLRRWGKRDGVYVSCGRSVTSSLMPETSDHVRGENGPGCWQFRPAPGQPNKCVYTCLINTDLKGWLPQYVVDQALSGVLLDYLKHVRKHMEEVLSQARQA